MPEINGKNWTRDQVHAALKDGRVEELWPGATFVVDPSGAFGRLTFADGSRAKINFERL